MAQHKMLPECKEWLVKLTESTTETKDSLVNISTDIAVIKAHQENHIESQGKSIDRLWKVIYVLIGSVGAGGSAAGVVSWLG